MVGFGSPFRYDCIRFQFSNLNHFIRWLGAGVVVALATLFGYLFLMAHVHETKLTFRICGDSLDPARVSQQLEAAPTSCHAKGDRIRSKTTGAVRIARAGVWQLSAVPRSSGNLDEQIRELLSQMSDDFVVWRKIGSQYSTDLFAGLFLSESNEGLTISADTVKMMADRRLELSFDVYAPDED